MSIDRSDKARSFIDENAISSDPSAMRAESASKRRHPLGMPAGSVRALLTLCIVGVVVVQTAKGQATELLWAETLMIALAHYFTSRRLIELPPDVMRELERQGYVDRESHPLFLPKNSVRTMIFAAFAGLAFYLYNDGRLLAPEAASTLGLVAFYFLGLVVGGIRNFLHGEKPLRDAGMIADAKALAVLGVVFYTAGCYVFDLRDWLPRALEDATLGLSLFYFGSR